MERAESRSRRPAPSILSFSLRPIKTMDVLAAIRDPDRLPPLTRAKAQRAVNTIGRTLDLYG